MIDHVCASRANLIALLTFCSKCACSIKYRHFSQIFCLPGASKQQVPFHPPPRTHYWSRSPPLKKMRLSDEAPCRTEVWPLLGLSIKQLAALRVLYEGEGANGVVSVTISSFITVSLIFYFQYCHLLLQDPTISALLRLTRWYCAGCCEQWSEAPMKVPDAFNRFALCFRSSLLFFICSHKVGDKSNISS